VRVEGRKWLRHSPSRDTNGQTDITDDDTSMMSMVVLICFVSVHVSYKQRRPKKMLAGLCVYVCVRAHVCACALCLARVLPTCRDCAHLKPKPSMYPIGVGLFGLVLSIGGVGGWMDGWTDVGFLGWWMNG
jgi:hypothetical protein